MGHDGPPIYRNDGLRLWYSVVGQDSKEGPDSCAGVLQDHREDQQLTGRGCSGRIDARFAISPA